MNRRDFMRRGLQGLLGAVALPVFAAVKPKAIRATGGIKSSGPLGTSMTITNHVARVRPSQQTQSQMARNTQRAVKHANERAIVIDRIWKGDVTVRQRADGAYIGISDFI